MTRRRTSAIGSALLIAALAVAWFWPRLTATSAPTIETAATRTIPLGPPRASVPTSPPASYHAFPADILTQTRAAMIAHADKPLSRSAVYPGTND